MCEWVEFLCWNTWTVWPALYIASLHPACFCSFFCWGEANLESLVILSWWANFDGSFWCVVSWFSRHVPACPCIGQRPQTFREYGQPVLWQESFLWSSLLDPGMALADAYEAGNWHCRGYPWQRDSTWFHKESGAIFPCRVVICFDATLPDSRFPHTWQLTLKTTSIQASSIRLLAMMHLSTPI